MTATIQYQKGMDALLVEIKKCSDAKGKVRCITCGKYDAAWTSQLYPLFPCAK